MGHYPEAQFVVRASLTRSSRTARATSTSTDPTQIKALLSAARGDRLKALYMFAIHTGLRRSEILGLKWTDVDLEAGVLSVQRSLDTNGTFNPPKRNKSRRTIKLTDQAIEALKSRRARQNEELAALGLPLRGSRPRVP
jgi:integrase